MREMGKVETGGSNRCNRWGGGSESRVCVRKASIVEPIKQRCCLQTANGT